MTVSLSSEGRGVEITRSLRKR